jgi:glycosyltransferase involved in cell wall biosynthesis
MQTTTPITAGRPADASAIEKNPSVQVSESREVALSVVMITLNEEKAIGPVVEAIHQSAPEAEILIVDSSTDRTPEIAAAMGVKVVRQFPKRGYGRAMDLALRSAGGDVIVTLDCDNTYPADRIHDLARAITEEGYDLVDGSRLQFKPQAMPWINYLANLGFGLLASVLFGRWLKDLHSGMRAYRRTLIEELRYNPQGAALPVELLLRPLKQGKKLKVMFINYHERLGQSTLRPLESAWWTLKRILLVRFGNS